MFGRNAPPQLADAPQSLDDARAKLLLRVYGAEQSGVDQLQAAVTGTTEGLSALRQISPEVSVGAVVDLSEGYMKVSPQTLQSWGCALGDVIQACCDRTREQEFTASRLGEATILIQDEVHASAIWVMPQMASSLPIKGSPLAWAIGRGTSLITGCDDPQGMMIAAATIQEFLQRGERIESVTPHRLTDIGWEPAGWASTPDHTDQLVQRLHKSQIYNRQTEPLRGLLASRGQQVGVNEYTVVRKPDGHPWAIANWAQDAPAAIPVVDEVVLVRSDGASVGVAWAALFDRAQELLEPVTDLPTRYLTKGFPTDEMVMAALGRG